LTSLSTHAIIILCAAGLLAGCGDDTANPTVLDSFGFRRIGGFTTLGSARGLCFDEDTVFVADNELGVSIWKLNANGATFLDTLDYMNSVAQVAYAAQCRLLFVLSKTWHNEVIALDRSADYQYAYCFGNKLLEDFYIEDVSPDAFLIIYCGVELYGIYAVRYFRNVDLDIWDCDMWGHFDSRLRSYHAIERIGSYLFVAQGEWGLQVFRLDRAEMYTIPITELGLCDLYGSALDVAVDSSARCAYLACQFAGLAVVNISDPDYPRLLAQFVPDGVRDAFKVAVDGNTVYMLDRENGLFAIDVTVRTAPRLIGVYHSPKPSSITVRASDHTLFLTDEYQGVIVLQMQS